MADTRELGRYGLLRSLYALRSVIAAGGDVRPARHDRRIMSPAGSKVATTQFTRQKAMAGTADSGNLAGMGLHAADVGGLEIGVEGYGFLPVMAGLVEVVGGVVGAAKACSEPAVGCPHSQGRSAHIPDHAR